jgi:hypothetical protein
MSCNSLLDLQVVKHEELTIDRNSGAFTFSGVTGLHVDVLNGKITTAVCSTGQCFVRKDTMFVPPGYATTLRLQAPGRPGLFMWHW